MLLPRKLMPKELNGQGLGNLIPWVCTQLLLSIQAVLILV